MKYLPDAMKNILDDLRFDTMSNYRLNAVKWEYLHKQFMQLKDDLERLDKEKEQKKQEYITNMEKYESNEDRVKRNILISWTQARFYENMREYENKKTAYTTQIAKLENNLNQVAISRDQSFNLLKILNKLKVQHAITEQECLQLKDIPYYDNLSLRLTDVASAEHTMAALIPESDEALQKQLEEEFKSTAERMVKECNIDDRYAFARLLQRIGWLNDIKAYDKYNLSSYHGENFIETFEKFSFKKLQTKKILPNNFTSYYGIREKAIKIFKHYQQTKQDQLASEKTHKDELKQKYLASNNDSDKEAYTSYSLFLKNEKIQKSKLEENKQDFRTSMVIK